MGAAERIEELSVGAAARRDWAGAAVVAAAVFIVTLPFLARLGFYSDDWALLWEFRKDHAAGKFGLATLLRGYEARPLQGIQLGLQYLAFGLQPLPHHIVNTTVLAGGCGALFLLLARMEIRRDIALAAALIFVVMPQLSTSRVWYSTFQIPTAMLLALLSLHAQLSFTRGGRLPWLTVAALCALASMAAYETFAPLVLFFPAWLILASWRNEAHKRRAIWLGVAALVTVLFAVIAKYALTDRAQSPDAAMYVEGLKRLVDPTYDWRTQGSLNIFATVEVNLWQPFVGMARATAAVFKGQLGAGAVLAGVAVAALAFWALARQGRNNKGALGAFVVGLAIFAIAHTPFLINGAIMFAPTGICNRTQVAMGIGVALMIGAALAWLANRLPGPGGRLLLALPVSLLVLTAAWRTGQIMTYWAETWTMEQQIIASTRRDLAPIPANSKVMFDGVCPYHGPAIVLETWEAEGMLSLALNRFVRGDTSTDNMQITDRGLTTQIYDDNPLYPYGPDLYVYDPHRHLVLPIPNREAAERYFSRPGRQRECPAGYLCQGELI